MDTSFPTVFFAGDTFSVTRSPSTYPATSGWTLKIALTPLSAGTAGVIQLASTASEDAHVFTATKATTANWGAGTYYLREFAESTTERFQLGQYLIEIRPDPASATVVTSTAEQILAALKAAYVKLTGSVATSSVSINGKSYTRTNLIELRTEISHWQSVVDRERKLETGKSIFQSYQVRI